MNFLDKLEQSLKEGLDASHELYKKARGKVVELGEMGISHVEKKQLEARAEKLMTKLGTETYHLLVAEQQKTVSRGSEKIKDIITELESLHEILNQKSVEEKEIEKGSEST